MKIICKTMIMGISGPEFTAELENGVIIRITEEQYNDEKYEIE